MYIDKDTTFSQDQAVTAQADAQHVVDLGVGDAGPSNALSLFVTASRAFTGGTGLTVDLLTSDTLAGGTLSGPVTVAAYPVAGAALLQGGALVAARLPHGMKRYAALRYKPDGALAGGAITATLVMDVQAEA